MTKENTRIQNFIDVHKQMVLRDAILDLQNCEVNKLHLLLHRLKGSLGTFQFKDISAELGKLLVEINAADKELSLFEIQNRALAVLSQELEMERK